MSGFARREDTKLRRRRQQEALALDVLEECRVQLMLKFRFLDLALWRMEAVAAFDAGRYPLATDAQHVFFDPPRIIARYGEAAEEVVRDYLHVVMHCVFRHPFDEGHARKDAWWLACDIVAESAAMDLCGARFASEDDPERRQALSEVRLAAGSVVPHKVYKLLVEVMQAPEGASVRGVSASSVARYRDLFERCNHEAWPANATAAARRAQQPGDVEQVADGPDGDDGDEGVSLEPVDAVDANDARDAQVRAMDEGDRGPDEPDEGVAADGGDEVEAGARAEMAGGDSDDARESDPDGDSQESDESDRAERERLRKEWEDLSKEIETDLETFSREWGDDASGLVAALRAANRTRYDYREFLRRFMVLSEEMELNHDEFDYVFYSYGMELYGNMPLVEPLEYRETKRVRSFVIALDTSNSVRGDLLRQFVDHTFRMMKDVESYTRKIDVHIIQCDARVQAHTRVNDVRDVDALMERFHVRGFGGTDFRPVFDYVADLRKRGELPEMQGLVYFTDGLGQFPEKPPDYDTAFVFMADEGADAPPVPPWAMKVVIGEEELEDLEAEGGRRADAASGSGVAEGSGAADAFGAGPSEGADRHGGRAGFAG